MDANQDQVVFENIPDQYTKGEDVKVHFRTPHEILPEGNEDRIGILRADSTNIEECTAYAVVEIDCSVHHGTATFPPSLLPANDEEFYQFCYISKKGKCLGTSIPFLFNCSMIDLDLLDEARSEATDFKSANDTLFALNDHDHDDTLIVHTRSMLVEEKLRQENRQLLEINRRLEQQRTECKGKLEALEAKSNEYLGKMKNDMQNLTTAHKATIEELSSRQRLEAKLRTEYDACRSLCNQYQSEALQFAERCRALEESNTKHSTEANRLNSQLVIAKQMTEEQNLQIADLEKHLAESTNALKTANQYQYQLEQQFRDLSLTSEKYQLSMQGQLDAYTKQVAQQENQLHALESANSLLKEELNSMKSDNIFLVSMTKQDKQVSKELEEQIEQLHQIHQFEQDEMRKELHILEEKLDEAKANERNYKQLKNSFNEIEKRCIKHQKNEVEAKKQLIAYKEFIADLQNQIQGLTERVLVGGEEYKTLYRKYLTLQRSMNKDNHPTTLSNETGLNEEALVTLLRNSYELQQQEEKVEEKTNLNNDTEKIVSNAEIRECPMCYWEFPTNFTLEAKKEHIDHHFA